MARGAGAARQRAGATAVATLALFLTAVAFALWPESLAQLPNSSLGTEDGILIVQVVALAAGVGAGALTFRKAYATAHLSPASYEPVRERAAVSTLPGWLSVSLASVLAFGVAATVAWLTVEGLRVGFL